MKGTPLYYQICQAQLIRSVVCYVRVNNESCLLLHTCAPGMVIKASSLPEISQKRGFPSSRGNHNHFFITGHGLSIPHPLTYYGNQIKCSLCFVLPDKRARYTKVVYDRSVLRQSLLLRSGIESNPGPRQPKYPCGICTKACKTGCIACDDCDTWIHKECIGMSITELSRIGHSEASWTFQSCSKPK